jgi:UDP-N-acetylmuramyl pentapeptide phosphotransferase/UDP-N-acetylglucosamine-1-phosphate transferase
MDNLTWIALFKVIATGLISGVIVLRAIPAINLIARTKGLLNAPGERTSHRYKTPNLAGIAVFLGACVASLFFISEDLRIFKTIYLVSIIIFFTGLKDDISLIPPWKKLLAQIVVAILIVMADLRFIHTFGLLGSEQLSEIMSVVITIIFIVGIINAINLIDGIDGLAAAIGMLILGSYGLFFFINEMYSWSIYCASMIGALLAFFQYNVFGLRNKTFMGDSGSLLVGTSIAVTTIMFWEANINKELPLTFLQTPAIALAIIIVPVFDTTRIFVYRIVRRASPFSADRNHLHHRFIDIGLTHFQTTLIITALNILMIAAAILLTLFLGTIWTAVTLLVLVLIVMFFVNRTHKKKMMGGGNRLIINRYD